MISIIVSVPILSRVSLAIPDMIIISYHQLGKSPPNADLTVLQLSSHSWSVLLPPIRSVTCDLVILSPHCL